MSNQATPYVARNPGDLLSAGDWNQMQLAIRADILANKEAAKSEIREEGVEKATDCEKFDSKSASEWVAQLDERYAPKVHDHEEIAGYRRYIKRFSGTDQDIALLRHGLGRYPLVDLYELKTVAGLIFDEERRKKLYEKEAGLQGCKLFVYYGHREAENYGVMANVHRNKLRIGVPLEQFLSELAVRYEDDDTLIDKSVDERRTIQALKEADEWADLRVGLAPSRIGGDKVTLELPLSAGGGISGEMPPIARVERRISVFHVDYETTAVVVEHYDGSERPFEGELPLVLCSLPVGARIEHARFRLEPVEADGGGAPFSETLRFRDGQGDWGATLSYTSDSVEVDFHARRTLVKVEGDNLEGAALQIDLGGTLVEINERGTIRSPDEALFSLPAGGELPPLTVNRFRLLAPGARLRTVTIRSTPSNLQLLLPDVGTVWSLTGELTAAQSSPDLGALLQQLLPRLEQADGYSRLPFILHSDTLGRLRVSVEIDYLMEAGLLPAGLPEVTFPFRHATLPEVENTLLQATLPPEAVVLPGKSRIRLTGAFEESRIAVGPLGSVEHAARLPVTPSLSRAQPLTLERPVALSALDLLLAATTEEARLRLDLRGDLDGKPDATSLLQEPVACSLKRGQSDRPTWIRSVTPATDGAPGMQHSSDGGFSWRRSTVGETAGPVTGWLRLRQRPARYQVPLLLQVGKESAARQHRPRLPGDRKHRRRRFRPMAVRRRPTGWAGRNIAGGPTPPADNRTARGAPLRGTLVTKAESSGSLCTVLDGETGHVLDGPVAMANGIVDMAVSPDGALLYLVQKPYDGKSGKIEILLHVLTGTPKDGRLYRYETRRHTLLGEPLHFDAGVTDLAITPSGGTAAVGLVTGVLQLIDTERWGPGPEIPLDPEALPAFLQLSPDGRWGYVTGQKNDQYSLSVIDIQRRTVVREQSVTVSSVTGAALTPGGCQLYLGVGDGSLLRFDVPSPIALEWMVTEGRIGRIHLPPPQGPAAMLGEGNGSGATTLAQPVPLPAGCEGPLRFTFQGVATDPGAVAELVWQDAQRETLRIDRLPIQRPPRQRAKTAATYLRPVSSGLIPHRLDQTPPSGAAWVEVRFHLPAGRAVIDDVSLKRTTTISVNDVLQLDAAGKPFGWAFEPEGVVGLNLERAAPDQPLHLSNPGEETSSLVQRLPVQAGATFRLTLRGHTTSPVPPLAGIRWKTGVQDGTPADPVLLHIGADHMERHAVTGTIPDGVSEAEITLSLPPGAELWLHFITLEQFHPVVVPVIPLAHAPGELTVTEGGVVYDRRSAAPPPPTVELSPPAESDLVRAKTRSAPLLHHCGSCGRATKLVEPADVRTPSGRAARIGTCRHCGNPVIRLGIAGKETASLPPLTHLLRDRVRRTLSPAGSPNPFPARPPESVSEERRQLARLRPALVNFHIFPVA